MCSVSFFSAYGGTAAMPVWPAAQRRRSDRPDRRLASAGVHFEVRVLAKLLDTHEHAAHPLRHALLGATVGALLPRCGDHGHDSVSGSATAHRLAQVQAGRRVEAHIPDTVGGQPAAVAAAAE